MFFITYSGLSILGYIFASFPYFSISEINAMNQWLLAMKQSWHVVLAYACENLVLAVCIFTSVSYELVCILVPHILGFIDIQNVFFLKITLCFGIETEKEQKYVKLTLVKQMFVFGEMAKIPLFLAKLQPSSLRKCFLNFNMQ